METYKVWFNFDHILAYELKEFKGDSLQHHNELRDYGFIVTEYVGDTDSQFWNNSETGGVMYIDITKEIKNGFHKENEVFVNIAHKVKRHIVLNNLV